MLAAIKDNEADAPGLGLASPLPTFLKSFQKVSSHFTRFGPANNFYKRVTTRT